MKKEWDFCKNEKYEQVKCYRKQHVPDPTVQCGSLVGIIWRCIGSTFNYNCNCRCWCRERHCQNRQAFLYIYVIHPGLLAICAEKLYRYPALRSQFCKVTYLYEIKQTSLSRLSNPQFFTHHATNWRHQLYNYGHDIMIWSPMPKFLK